MDKEKEIINIIRDCFPLVQDLDDKDISTVYKGGAVWKTIEKTILKIKKQAVKEFAEKVKAEVNNLPKTALSFSVRREAPMLIDLVYKELYGADE